MRLHRFFTSAECVDTLVYTNQEHLHQWFKVFRYGIGDSVILFGDGFEHTYQITSFQKRECTLARTNVTNSRMQPKRLTLAMSLIKKSNFELILEKCTEIGITDFIPVFTERSEQHMYGDDRLQKILTEAAEQSGWGKVPTLHKPVTFSEFIQKNTKSLVMFHTGGGTQSLEDIDTLLIGPEGGFSEAEILLAQDKQVRIVTLETGVLRAETAAIVCSALLVI